MKFKDKVEALETYLVEHGEKKRMASPPLLRLLWKFGLEVPPPIFLSFGKIALFLGGYFGTFWGAFMYFFFWRKKEGNDIALNITQAVFSGVLFGVFMAAYFVRKKQKLKLPDWNHFPPQRENDTEPAVGAYGENAS